MRELIYKIKLRQFIFNYSVDKELDDILRKCLESGIKTYIKNSGYIRLIFNNGADARMWDESKYYAWLSDGYITKDDLRFGWTSKMPSVEVMYKLKCLINGIKGEFGSLHKELCNEK